MIDVDETKPSEWVSGLVGVISPGASVLDVPCGQGRHSRLFLKRGCKVTLVDIDLSGVADLTEHPNASLIECDLEEDGLDFTDRLFDLIIITNYVWRPLLARVPSILSKGGIVVCESYSFGHQRFKNEWLLEKNELIRMFSNDLSVVAFEEGQYDLPTNSVRQMIVARNDMKNTRFFSVKSREFVGSRGDA